MTASRATPTESGGGPRTQPNRPAPPDIDELSSSIRLMAKTAAVEAPLERDISWWLAGVDTARIADVGCGIGAMAVQLANVLPVATVVAADLSGQMVDAARRHVQAAGVSKRVDVRRVDLTATPVTDERFDLVWASAVIHHLPDQLEGLRALRTLLCEGGRLALAEGGLPVHRLPWDLGVGRQGLEVRLHLAGEELFERLRRGLVGGVDAPHGWSALLRDAGFDDVTSRSFLLDHPAPVDRLVSDVILEQLRASKDRLGGAGVLGPDDVATLAQLTDEGSEHFLGRRDDLHYLTVRTVHLATAPAGLRP